ncbi:MAG: hypothetical protein ACXAB9_13050 [Candidatus Thorarchaeota archaeon]
MLGDTLFYEAAELVDVLELIDIVHVQYGGEGFYTGPLSVKEGQDGCVFTFKNPSRLVGWGKPAFHETEVDWIAVEPDSDQPPMVTIKDYIYDGPDLALMV